MSEETPRPIDRRFNKLGWFVVFAIFAAPAILVVYAMLPHDEGTFPIDSETGAIQMGLDLYKSPKFISRTIVTRMMHGSRSMLPSRPG